MSRSAELIITALLLLGLVACALPPRPAASTPVIKATRPPADKPSPLPAAVATVLAYADKARGLSAAEIGSEMEQLKAREGAVAWLQMSLLLAHKGGELARAQELAVQAQGDGSPEGQQVRPLARLLAHRLGEQRRAEEQLDRQSRQLSELQKRMEQQQERLEALRAIERSLGRRSPARSAERPSVP